MNVSSPILGSYPSSGDSASSGLTPVDPPSSGSQEAPMRAKNVSWSPKVIHKVAPAPLPPVRSHNGANKNGMNHNSNGNANGRQTPGGLRFELDPDTSVTPLETYRSQNKILQNHSKQNGTLRSNGSDVQQEPESGEQMQSNSSLTLYF